MSFDNRNARVGVSVGVTMPGPTQYSSVKPSLSLEVDVLPGEDPDEVLDNVTAYLMERLGTLEEELGEYIKE